MELDNRKAHEEGLLTIEVADVGILSSETTDRWFFFMPYVLLKVGDRQYKFMESSLSHALLEGKLEIWLPKYEKQIYTAGGVQNPDFIFGNVRFNSKDNIYRIPTSEVPSAVKAKNLYES